MSTPLPGIRLARVETPRASSYLQQLCKHFGHKIPASFDTAQGTLDFPLGQVRLAADDSALQIRVETPEADKADTLADVIARHLLRFTFRETPVITWTTP